MKIMNYFSIFTALVFVSLFSTAANAADVDTVIGNIQDSSLGLSGLMAAVAYLTGTLMAVLAIFKTINHVSNPTQTSIREPIVRFLIGGGLFALPIVLEAAYRTINGGGAGILDVEGASLPLLPTTVIATASGLTGLTFNALLLNITNSTSLIPGLVAMTAYMLGILLSISGLIKIREHVDDPTRTTIKEPIIRLLIAGALFALPTVFTAMYDTVADGGFGLLGGLLMANTVASLSLASDATIGAFGITFATPQCLTLGLGNTLGDVICALEVNTIGMPTFLAALSYVLGLIFGVWGLFKIRDHVLNPTQTGISEGVTRLLAGGAFFAMPFIANIMTTTVTPLLLTGFQAGLGTNTGFVDTSLISCTFSILLPSTNSLDEAFVCLMSNVMGPLQAFVNFFCLTAGMIFIMIGISRLIRSSQEGARGPGGRGTLATFLVGGVLISANAILRAVSTSLFSNPITSTSATLAYSGGMSVAELAATYNVISAVLKFMIVIGLISFVRGIFIMRDVAEGNQQASTMAGITHILGGALAVNLGPLLNAVQTTLGVTAFGVTFS